MSEVSIKKQIINAGGVIATEEFLKEIDRKANEYRERIVKSKSEYEAKGTVYYVSNSGNDENDGLSPETAWATPARVVAQNDKLSFGDVILFERGGTFRGQIVAKEGVTYSAYGEGKKPNLYGSKRNYADPALWEMTDAENIYRLKTEVVNVGIIGFDLSDEYGNWEDGEWGKKQMVGYGPFSSYADLKEDLHFYSDLETNILYVYSDKGNPGERFSVIEIGERHNEILAASNITVDNLCIKYCGAHGVGTGTSENITVKNCIFAWIGGGILDGKTTRYGNAVEIYGGCDGFTVVNNWIYEMYDTGITIQHGGAGDCSQKNVNFSGNLVERCHWALEYYNAGKEGNKEIDGIVMKDNICRYTGYGWGSAHRKNVSITLQSCGITENVKNFVVESNIFDRTYGAHLGLRAGGDKHVVLKNNTYVHTYGGDFGNDLDGRYEFDLNARKLLLEKNHEQEPVVAYIIEE